MGWLMGLGLFKCLAIYKSINIYSQLRIFQFLRHNHTETVSLSHSDCETQQLRMSSGAQGTDDQRHVRSRSSTCEQCRGPYAAHPGGQDGRGGAVNAAAPTLLSQGRPACRASTVEI